VKSIMRILAGFGSLAAALALAAGCAATTADTRPQGTGAPTAASTRPAWPPPPVVARLEHLQIVTGPADWGIERGALTKFVDLFTGRRELPLVRPTGVAERDGVLYIADPGARAVRVFDGPRRKDIAVTRLGEDLVLASPVAVAPGPDGSVFVADSGLRKVFAVDRDGKFVRVVVHDGLVRPAALAFDAARGRLYVADSMAHRVFVYSTDGTPLGDFGGNGLAPGAFNSPTHLAVSRDGRLYVTDALNFRVQAFDESHRPLMAFGRHGDGAGDFAAPKGIAVDSQGHVFVADAMFDAVQVFRPDGVLLLGFGSQGSGVGQFWLPNGLYVNGADHLFVADAYNRRVQVFRILPDPPAQVATP
jgi:DNA-binding beta-propeller fold protein YncE